jgi:hypothetical protein
VKLIGRLLMAGSVAEGLLLLASIGFGWTIQRPAPLAYAILLLVGAASIAATAWIGWHLVGTQIARAVGSEPDILMGSSPPVTDARAIGALVVGIASIALIWPLGVLLGPIALGLGTSAVRRISRRSDLTGSQLAKPGAVMGAIVCAGYLFWVLADVAAVFLFGSPIPAAP